MKINDSTEVHSAEAIIESAKNIKFNIEWLGEDKTSRWGKVGDIQVLETKPTIKHWTEGFFNEHNIHNYRHHI